MLTSLKLSESVAKQRINVDVYSQFLSKVGVDKSSHETRITSHEKDDIVANLSNLLARLQPKFGHEYVDSIYIYKAGLLEIDFSDHFVDEFDFSHVTFECGSMSTTDAKILLIKNMLSTLIMSCGIDKLSKAHCVYMTPYLLIYSLSLFTKSFSRLTIKLSEDSLNTMMKDSAFDNITTEHEIWRKTIPGILLNSKYQLVVIHSILQSVYSKFVCTMLLLMFRKHGFYKVAINESADDLDTSDNFSDQVSWFQSHSVSMSYCLIPIKGITKTTLKLQYPFETQTVDCFFQYCIHFGLSSTTIKEFGTKYFHILELFFVTDQEYDYKHGNLKLAYSVCVMLYGWLSDSLPNYIFKYENGLPGKLNQLKIMRSAARSLALFFDTNKGLSNTIWKISENIDEIFKDMPILLEKYHKGHLNFKSYGPSIKDVWSEPIAFLATLGTAMKFAISELNKEREEQGERTLSWLRSPLFRNAEVNKMEVELCKNAIVNLFSNKNDNIIRIFSESMAISSDMTNYNAMKISIHDLMTTR